MSKNYKLTILIILISTTILSGCGKKEIAKNNTPYIEPPTPQNPQHITPNPPPEIQSQSNNKDETASPMLTFPAVTDCAFWDKRIYGKIKIESIEGIAGTLDIKGNIVSRVEAASWEINKKVTRIYLALSKPESNHQQILYDYYMAMAKAGNTVNQIDEEQLLFRLGVKEDSKLISSADISDDLSNRLALLANKADIINLKITIPIYDGGGASDKFSFACKINAKSQSSPHSPQP